MPKGLEALSYIAGVMDSDGYIGIVRKQRNHMCYSPKVQVSQVAPEAIDFIRSHYPKGLFRKDHWSNRVRNHRDQYRWESTKREVVIEFLLDILPFLKIKKKQAEIVLEFCLVRREALKYKARDSISGRLIAQRGSKYNYGDIEARLWQRTKSLNQAGLGVIL